MHLTCVSGAQGGRTEEGGGRGGQRVHLKPNIRKRTGKKVLKENSLPVT